MHFKDSVKHFRDLIHGYEISLLLKRDVCHTLIDKYHLMSVFLYFNRARFTAKEYTVRNFCLALFLNHEVYEEVDHYKIKIIKFCLGHREKYEHVVKFLDDRFSLFRRMNYNTLIDMTVCEKLFKLIPDSVWTRRRRAIHSGVIRDELKLCEYCKYPIM